MNCLVSSSSNLPPSSGTPSNDSQLRIAALEAELASLRARDLQRQIENAHSVQQGASPTAILAAPPDTQSQPQKIPFGIQKSELETMKTDCDPGQVTAFFAVLQARVPPDVVQLLSMTPDEAAAAFVDPNSGAAWRTIDSDLATLLLTLVRNDTKRSMNFRRKLAAQPAALKSGHKLACMLASITTANSTAEYDERLERVDNGVYFRMGMAQVDAEAAANEFRDDWSLTAAASGSNSERDLIRRLIKKFPPELESKSEDLAAKLTECEITGAALPWSYDQLAAILAVYLRSKKKKIKTQHADDESEAFNASKNPNAKKPPCNNCGSMQHGYADCPARCVDCDLPFCAGADPKRKHLCYATGKGGATAKVNCFGKPLQPWMIEKLAERGTAMAKENSSKNDKEASAAVIENGVTLGFKSSPLTAASSALLGEIQDTVHAAPKVHAMSAAEHWEAFAAIERNR